MPPPSLLFLSRVFYIVDARILVGSLVPLKPKAGFTHTHTHTHTRTYADKHSLTQLMHWMVKSSHLLLVCPNSLRNSVLNHLVRTGRKREGGKEEKVKRVGGELSWGDCRKRERVLWLD